jgi:hypothetical protein
MLIHDMQMVCDFFFLELITGVISANEINQYPAFCRFVYIVFLSLSLSLSFSLSLSRDETNGANFAVAPFGRSRVGQNRKTGKKHVQQQPLF